MEKLICYYHPNREATNKCARCGKYICLECQNVVHISSGTSSSSGVYTNIYCSECKKKREEEGKKMAMIILPLFGCFCCFVIIFGIFCAFVLPNLLDKTL